LDSPDQPRESRTELLKVADEEADHLRDLIDNAVEMARLSTAEIEVHREIADPGEMVRDVVTSLEAEIDGRPFEIRCDEHLPAIAADRRLVKLALKQVLDNALKYSPPRAAVAIGIRQEGETIVVEITDHGKGIPIQEQSRIFDRFYRSPSIQQQIPGSGLGLSIAHSIVRAHNGDLTVASRPGETTFRVILPVNAQGESS
jgi:two-component system sensor histidine kinase KdpD